MIHREYIVQMPNSVATVPLDIVVEGFPGSSDAPVNAANSPVGWSGGDGAYYEWTGRPLRLPVKAADGSTGGFIPRLTLGFLVTITPIAAALSVAVPGVQLSQTLASLASTDTGPSMPIPTLADPTYGPVIRLVGDTSSAGAFYVVSLQVMEPKDNDRSPTGV
jgi:hypothetical protein